jgi:hypothetical protein
VLLGPQGKESGLRSLLPHGSCNLLKSLQDSVHADKSGAFGQNRVTAVELSFAKSLCPKLKGILPVWRQLFGLGLQADSSSGERCSLGRHEPSSAGLQARRLVIRKWLSNLRGHRITMV